MFGIMAANLVALCVWYDDPVFFLMTSLQSTFLIAIFSVVFEGNITL
jgi:hypothetical protein